MSSADWVVDTINNNRGMLRETSAPHVLQQQKWQPSRLITGSFRKYLEHHAGGVHSSKLPLLKQPNWRTKSGDSDREYGGGGDGGVADKRAENVSAIVRL